MLSTLLKALIALHGGLSPVDKYPSNYGPILKDGDEFDFIVVGAGSAGSVVASRLSEIPEWRILLLEAGGYPSGTTEVPALAFALHDTDEDWQYKTEPSNSSCASHKNKVCKVIRGKVLGGSSSINLMMYTRSTKYDHARWASDGNDEWEHESVSTHYRRFENVNIQDNKHYGTNGELHLTRYTSKQLTRQILMKAYEELGYDEYTEDGPIGFWDSLVSIYQGTRQNAAKAFLIPAKERKNLYISTNAQVSKLLVNPNELSVHGVEVKIGNKIIKIQARKEVILSAGSINSPHILMNSGIGPKEHLAEIGIEVVKDLKVGENLQDHYAFPLPITVDQSAVSPLTTLRMMDELYQFFINREGTLSTLDVSNFCSYVNTKNRTDFGDIQLVNILFPHQDPFLLEDVLNTLGIDDNVSQTLITNNQDFPLIAFLSILLHPKSRGFVRLQNADPFSKPTIIPNYVSDEDDEDINVLLESIKVLKRLMKTQAFIPYTPKIIDINITNCQEFVYHSDDFWKCCIRNFGITMYHQVGTCKMGPASDASAVVDPKLRVHGVKGVRVIDGSIMPTISSANTNAPIMMIGEKGAALVKDEWITKRDEL